MSISENYSMQHNLAQAQAAMAQLMILSGKEACTSGKIADTQTAIADKFKTSTDDVVAKSKALDGISWGVAGLSVLSSLLGGLGACGGFNNLTGGLRLAFNAVTYGLAPAAKGSLECIEGKAQIDLGDAQKVQSEYGSGANLMSGQSQAVIDGESQVSQKAAAISRNLSQIIADEKQASM